MMSRGIFYLKFEPREGMKKKDSIVSVIFPLAIFSLTNFDKNKVIDQGSITHPDWQLYL